MELFTAKKPYENLPRHLIGNINAEFILSHSGRVMVVDDEEDILRLIEFALRKEGISVDLFCDPAKAFRHFLKYPNDYVLVITDIRMPDINGWELVAKLLSINENLQFIIMSAFVQGEPEALKGQFSGEDFLSKPFSMSTLVRRVKEKLAIVA